MNLDAVAALVDRAMTVTGTLQSVGTESVMDPETLEIVFPLTTVYEGRLLIWPDIHQRDAEAGEATWHINRYAVTLPAEAPVEVGQVLTVTGSPGDPELVGLKVRIMDAPLSAWSVARQCLAEQVT